LVSLLLQQKQETAIQNYVENIMNKVNIKTFLGQNTTQSAPVASKLQQTDKPEVSVYVMSYCPFGTQIEKGIIPVAEALKDKIDFNIKFCNYAMHGEKELKENTRQYCIEKEQNRKYLDYLKCFLDAGDVTNCIKKTSIDAEQLDKCMATTDSEFKITEGFNDKSTYANGRYPKFKIYEDEVIKYGVQGSPTIVINGAKVSSDRDPQSLANLICSAFKNKPSECNNKFSSDKPSSGFGFNSDSSGSTASCEV
jgi:protein-disulfide isomerase